jgi:ATP adenylyltransferase
VTERLWAPWRLDYVAGSAGGDSKECIFCAKQAAGDDDASLIVHRGRSCFVVLNLFPYSNGHLMVAPYRHIARPAELDAGERAELWELMTTGIAALEESMAPHGFNAGLNLGRVAGAGVEDHLHLHVVPRWNGDTNFMTAIGDTRVLPEDLAAAKHRLQPIFERLAASNA